MVAWGLAMIWACLGSMALSFLVFWGAFWNLGGVSSHPDVGHVWFWAIGPTALTAIFGSLPGALVMRRNKEKGALVLAVSARLTVTNFWANAAAFLFTLPS